MDFTGHITHIGQLEQFDTARGTHVITRDIHLETDEQFPKSDFSKEYLFELFLFEREKILSQANGSVFSNLKTDILKALTIIVPQENVLNRFQNIIGQIFRSIQQKQEEIISLTTLRDTLLPKLMSGEITV